MLEKVGAHFKSEAVIAKEQIVCKLLTLNNLIDSRKIDKETTKRMLTLLIMAKGFGDEDYKYIALSRNSSSIIDHLEKKSTMAELNDDENKILNICIALNPLAHKKLSADGHSDISIVSMCTNDDMYNQQYLAMNDTSTSPGASSSTSCSSCDFDDPEPFDNFGSFDSDYSSDDEFSNFDSDYSSDNDSSQQFYGSSARL